MKFPGQPFRALILSPKVLAGQKKSSLPSILSSAGANDCDILIAVTKSDETNMIACQIGLAKLFLGYKFV